MTITMYSAWASREQSPPTARRITRSMARTMNLREKDSSSRPTSADHQLDENNTTHLLPPREPSSDQQHKEVRLEGFGPVLLYSEPSGDDGVQLHLRDDKSLLQDIPLNELPEPNIHLLLNGNTQGKKIRRRRKKNQLSFQQGSLDIGSTGSSPAGDGNPSRSLYLQNMKFLQDKVDEMLNTSKENMEGDLEFFLSLSPVINAFTMEEKMQFRMGAMELARRCEAMAMDHTISSSSDQIN